jgi:hypothetical protein
MKTPEIASRDGCGAPRFVLPGGGRVHAAEVAHPRLTDELDLVDQKPHTAYSILELDPHSKVVDDNWAEDLEGAREWLDAYPGAVWEELPRTREQALAVLQERLTQPSRRNQPG